MNSVVEGVNRLDTAADPAAREIEAEELDALLYEFEELVHEAESPAASAAVLVDALMRLAALPEPAYEGAESPLAFLERAEVFVEHCPPLVVSLLQFELNVLYQRQGRYDDAIESILIALEAARIDHPHEVARYLAVYADLLRLSENWSRALEVLDEAEAALEQDPDKAAYYRGRCEVYGVRCQVYLRLGLTGDAWVWSRRETEASKRYLEGTVPQNGEPPTPYYLDALNRSHAAATRRADVFVNWGRSRDALNTADATLALQPAEGLRRSLEAIRAKALVQVEISQYGGQARSALEDLLKDGNLQESDRLHTQLNFVQVLIQEKDWETAKEVLVHVQTQLASWADDAGRAKVVLFRALAAAFASELAWRTGDTSGSALERHEDLVRYYREFLADWGRSPMLPGGISFLDNYQRVYVIGTVVRSSLRIAPEQPEDALDLLWQAQAMSSLCRRHGIEVPRLADVRAQLLGENGGLLMFLPEVGEGLVIAVDRQDVLTAPLPPRYRLLPHINNVHSQMDQRAETGKVLGAASPLVPLLFPDEIRARVAKWDLIQVVGSDMMGDIRLEWLPVLSSRALGLERAVSYLPSVPVGVWLAGADRRRTGRSTHDLRLVAAPTHSPQAQERWRSPEIQLSPRDLRRLTRAFSRVDRVLGDAAQRHRLDDDPGHVRVLHAMGHGVHEPSMGQGMGLLLSPSGEEDLGVLWSNEVRGLSVPELVLVSACWTAGGPVRLGEGGGETLAGAFLEAGANTVVASDAEVEVGPTVRLMGALSEELMNGHPVAKALLRARQRLAKEGLDRPDQQSRLHVIGLGHRPLPRH